MSPRLAEWDGPAVLSSLKLPPSKAGRRRANRRSTTCLPPLHHSIAGAGSAETDAGASSYRYLEEMDVTPVFSPGTTFNAVRIPFPHARVTGLAARSTLENLQRQHPTTTAAVGAGVSNFESGFFGQCQLWIAPGRVGELLPAGSFGLEQEQIGFYAGPARSHMLARYAPELRCGAREILPAHRLNSALSSTLVPKLAPPDLPGLIARQHRHHLVAARQLVACQVHPQMRIQLLQCRRCVGVGRLD